MGTRFKKEKAKKLEKIHEDFEKLQIKQQKVNNYQRRDQSQSNQRSQNGTPRKQYKKKSKAKEHSQEVSPDRSRNINSNNNKKKSKKKNSNSNGSKFGGGHEEDRVVEASLARVNSERAIARLAVICFDGYDHMNTV